MNTGLLRLREEAQQFLGQSLRPLFSQIVSALLDDDAAHVLHQVSMFLYPENRPMGAESYSFYSAKI